jgi:hypothetical protein
LYFAVNRRRFALSLTSVSGLSACKDITFAIIHASLAVLVIDSKLSGSDLLSYVGTEGVSRREVRRRAAIHFQPQRAGPGSAGQGTDWVSRDKNRRISLGESARIPTGTIAFSPRQVVKRR